jgi:hypothetical protein
MSLGRKQEKGDDQDKDWYWLGDVVNFSLAVMNSAQIDDRKQT